MKIEFNRVTGLSLIEQCHKDKGYCTSELITRKFPEIKGLQIATRINGFCDDKHLHVSKVEIDAKDREKYEITELRSKFRYTLTAEGKDFLNKNRDKVLTKHEIESIQPPPSARPKNEREPKMPENPYAKAMIESISDSINDYGLTVEAVATLGRNAHAHIARRNSKLEGVNEDVTGINNESNLTERGAQEAQSTGEQQDQND